MKLLCLHVDHFAYTFDHPTLAADDHTVGQHAEFGDALVVFLSVEPSDGDKVNHAAKEIRHAARRAATRQIVVNPFVHLTELPAPPEQAASIGEKLAARLEETFDGTTVYTSFGWYKSFRIDVRGDEHSQVFRHL